MNTYAHKFKCRPCGLHFVLYSWAQTREAPFCPECGGRGPFIHWLEVTRHNIFELVPGDSPLVGFGGEDAEQGSGEAARLPEGVVREAP